MIASCRSRCFSWTSSTPAGDPDSGRVHEQVEPAFTRDVLLDDARAVLRLGDVRSDRVRTQLCRRRLDLLGGAGREREGKPLLAEHLCDRQPDA